MQATADTLDLNPPQAGRWRGPLLIAVVVHLLLVLALTWGVGWQRDAQVVMEAELWSRLPEVAAPRASEPEPPQPPAPEPRPEPEPAPPPKPAPVAEPTGPSQAEIALQKKREKEREDKLHLEAERKKQEEARRREEQRQAEREAAAKREAERKKREAQAAKEKAEQTAREKEAARQQAQLEAERKKNLERMLGQAGAMGSSRSTGTAQQSSGPSASYAGKLVARIKPNIVFTETIPGNPRAEVEVRAMPDGTIVGRKLLKSSGHAGWDEAVLRAIDRTATLPKDENGRVPGTLELIFRPQD
ncbi:cell envelope integrity protein TolA [Hydrogenophaga aquatica]